MRSVIYNEFGKPSDVLTITDSPMPEPKDHEVRIKTILSSIHNHDLITIQGQYGTKPKLPALAGSEAVGTIDAIGAGVKGMQAGQRVVVTGVEGTWAEYFTAPASSVIPIPDAIDDEMAAQLIAMPMSALMLIEFLELEKGQWVIQNAANGAVGESLSMLAAERGIHTINVVRSKESANELTEIGITEKKHTSSRTLRVEAGTYFLIKNWKSLSFVQTFRESEKTIPVRIHDLFFTGSDLDNLMVIPEQVYFLYRLEVKGVTGWQNINAYEVFAKLDSGEWKETTSQMDWCRPGAGHFS